ncbi:CRISPR-associated endoribonuclease Cas6 [candidate division KSB1 bacterium]|nr:CRISPR-associated endoribonuclease Cas6 [candidate division KSB1 bacterium]NIS22706.1 CRISPR-associated endoribonuclease Cas6 [candidate division KSB1 bacterium]NIT69552.1 CRISPR-associated endoribonuclease Cas6 [candidate division KSB1 bacterium]NIU23206.1 CRISPR-associated endoribonuclease Cas6 [candidate division KSB1 bacterium]NIU90345.1 CRISPR-associated endoribonuclease Cas6 [candidate division KSB1 bacterium]
METVLEPRFSDEMTFSLLSPMVVSADSDTHRTAYYIRPEETDAFSEGVRKNLMFKYQTLRGKPPDSDTFRLAFDRDYINKKQGRISKLIRIRDTQVKAVLAPFTVTGSKELIWLGYECGFGEKNSMGFGMAKAVFSER